MISMSNEQIWTPEEYAHVEAWKTQCYEPARDCIDCDQWDFQCLAIGFFVGRGVDIEHAQALYTLCITMGCF